MLWIQNLELKKKLVLLAAVSGTMALLMACTGFIWHDLRLLRSAQIEELRSKAELLAFAGLATVEKPGNDAARSMLMLVKSHPSVATVGLFSNTGTPLTSDLPAGTQTDPIALPIEHDSYRYTEFGELELFYPMIERGREVGVVYLKANMREFYEQARSHATMIVILTLCSLAVALLFGSMMQSLISRPILQLADAARNITTNGDYTIRVTTDSRDELAVLYRSFNQMVQKIQTSQSELKQARDEMEIRVEQRTRELQDEISQRETIQQELVRAKEAAEAASLAKSRFLANMSHEIRTPLNGILGFADYIVIHDHSLKEADRRDYLRTIKRCGEGLLVLINDILDLSKIEAGQMDFERVRFSPHGVISDAISILRPKAREKNLSLEYRWDGVVPESIESDPLRLRQLLMNLIGNAVKFSETGGVNVVARIDPASRTLAIDVIDTGVGIPEETQTALFNPFTQGDSSVTRRFGGTGLGLSICKSIVEGLGGEIRYKSEQGQGSTFSFTVDTGSMDNVRMSSSPLEDIVMDEPSTADSILKQSIRSKRILVAEDGETNRKLIRLLLVRSGADVVLVENGLEAVVAVRNEQFDLILIDMQMPIMDGYSATAQLRAEGFTNPIVALTAHAMRGDEERCLQAGCTEYLSKPIRQELLLARIIALLSGKNVDVEPGDVTAPRPKDHSDLIVSELPIEEPPFAELVREFVERAHDKMFEMQSAYQSNNRTQLKELAHWMKGSGGMAGFPMLTDCARELEVVVKNSLDDRIEEKLTMLESLVHRLQSPQA
ncbi:ATP-binding protein [Schlesneria paludicola]|uniref:ATP-binding protein n=1 Tax=Schlesneria paludicola TaxID=360056 RepID=UPI00029A1F68|nr:ATP-binding protein [Schlesneria paludicola]